MLDLMPPQDSARNDTSPRESAGPRGRAGRLKICFISETVHSGVGRHIVDAICAFSKRGHEIHLLYSPIRLDPEFLATIRRQENVRCHPVRMQRAIGWSDLQAFAQIRTYVKRAGPFDVVHGHSAKGGGYARLLKLSGAGPVVYTPHAFITQSPALGRVKDAAYRTIEGALARVSDGVLCGSLAERDHALELGIAEDKLHVIANGTNDVATPPREAIREQLGLAADTVAVGFVGRMDDQKAPERLIVAARRIFPELPKLVLLMIGDGPKRPLLEDGLRRAGLAQRVKWLGAVNARQCMPAFDLLALPSLYEGFAYVLIEALYAGLPIVTTPVGGAYETVVPGANGFIVGHGMTDEMAGAIRALAAEPALRRMMGEASRARAAHFSIPRMADEIERVYRELAAARRAPGRETPAEQPDRSGFSFSREPAGRTD